MIPSVDDASSDMFSLERINVAPLHPKSSSRSVLLGAVSSVHEAYQKGNTEARYLVRNNSPTLVAFRILIARSASDLEIT